MCKVSPTWWFAIIPILSRVRTILKDTADRDERCPGLKDNMRFRSQTEPTLEILNLQPLRIQQFKGSTKHMISLSLDPISVYSSHVN